MPAKKKKLTRRNEITSADGERFWKRGHHTEERAGCIGWCLLLQHFSTLWRWQQPRFWHLLNDLMGLAANHYWCPTVSKCSRVRFFFSFFFYLQQKHFFLLASRWVKKKKQTKKRNTLASKHSLDLGKEHQISAHTCSFFPSTESLNWPATSFSLYATGKHSRMQLKSNWHHFDTRGAALRLKITLLLVATW